jgi:hypothetical protein
MTPSCTAVHFLLPSRLELNFGLDKGTRGHCVRVPVYTPHLCSQWWRMSAVKKQSVPSEDDKCVSVQNICFKRY